MRSPAGAVLAGSASEQRRWPGWRADPRIVIARKVGRLGNRLKLFAHFIGAALEHDLVVYNPAFAPYARYFPTTAHDLLCRFPPGRRVPSVPGGRLLLYRVTFATAQALFGLQRGGHDVGLIRLGRDPRSKGRRPPPSRYMDLNSPSFLTPVTRHRVVFVQGWRFRNGDNCARHRDAIRSYLTPWGHHLDRAQASLDPLRKRDRFVVGVHIRRTDFRTLWGGRFYFAHNQYQAVMGRVQALFGHRDVAFLICSDEAIPAEVFSQFEVIYGTGQEIEDLYALANCDRLIGPQSTYSAWASYYGEVPRYRIFDPDAPVTEDSFKVRTGLTSESDDRLARQST
jgi:hypothetical protein